ncbi:hypothetical protein [Palleronia sp.]|uniref:hypothetical protein n=1 Tax=Palleronia sp. TaxID=1940284 RepID=UPI0035C820DC
MIRLAAAALVASGLAAPAVAGAGTHGYVPTQYAPRVVVSCFRGPWQQIIWDHPNAVFVDSLVGIGYSFERASAIANRVCKDGSLVNNADGLKATTEAIIANSPRR